MSELVGAVKEALRTGGGDPVSRLGYFCAPFQPIDGPLAGHVIKAYRGGRDPELLEQLSRRHRAYVDCLSWAGVRVPETQFLILNEAGFLQPVIVQDALPPDTMLRAQIERDPLPLALEKLEVTARGIAAFWAKVAQRPERIGYHPSMRNFAFDADGPIFFDTFPPLIGYSREEMGRLLLRFSENGMIRGMGAVLPERMRGIQDEWYSPGGTLVGLIGSAIRLRPSEQAEILNWAQGFAMRALPDIMARDVLTALEAPPKLPALWTTTRRLLGLEGRPNV